MNMRKLPGGYEVQNRANGDDTGATEIRALPNM